MAATGRRYAQAAFELASEHSNLNRWEEDLARTADVLGDSDVMGFLAAPQVSDSAKLDGIGKLAREQSSIELRITFLGHFPGRVILAHDIDIGIR